MTDLPDLAGPPDGPVIDAIAATLDAHQRDVWADPQAAGGLEHGECSSTGTDGWEPHNEPFTRHQARMVAAALPPVQHYTPRVGAAALVLRGPLLLMVKRAGKHGDGTWSIPGGWQEFGEPVGYTAVREVHEETGLVVAGGAIVGVTDDWMPDETPPVHCTTWFVGCRYLEGEPVVTEPDKCPEVRWVHLDSLDSLDLFAPLRHFLTTNPTWRERVPTLDDPEGLTLPAAAEPEPEPTPPGLGLRAQRVVECYDRYMAPMEEFGPSEETWAAMREAIEALRAARQDTEPVAGAPSTP